MPNKTTLPEAFERKIIQGKNSHLNAKNDGYNACLGATGAKELWEALDAFRKIDDFSGWHPKYRDAIAKAEAALSKSNPK